MWQYRRYLPFTDGLGRDHVWALAPANATSWTASEYSLAASIAQATQYQALFEGFQENAWVWYTGILMWKSAAPWPSLRGALYDWYLAQSGGLFGARAALQGQLHVQLNRATNGVTVINRGGAIGEPCDISVEAFDVATGAALPLTPPFAYTAPTLDVDSILRTPLVLTPPPSAAPGATILWRLRATPRSALPAPSTSEYLLSTLDTNYTAAPQDFSALSQARYGGAPLLSLTASAICVATRTGAVVATVTLSLPTSSSGVAVAVAVVLHDDATAVTAETGFVDTRCLPQWPSDGFFAVTPGETRTVTIEAGSEHAASTSLSVDIDGWTVARTRIPCVRA